VCGADSSATRHRGYADGTCRKVPQLSVHAIVGTDPRIWIAHAHERAGTDAGGAMLFSYAIEGFLGWGFLGSVKRPYVQPSSPDRQKG
jgi:hypothetical protein